MMAWAADEIMTAPRCGASGCATFHQGERAAMPDGSSVRIPSRRRLFRAGRNRADFAPPWHQRATMLVGGLAAGSPELFHRLVAPQFQLRDENVAFVGCQIDRV